MKYLSLGVAAFAAAVLTGCETETPHYDATIGKSVAHMVDAQTYDPKAAANPPPVAPEVGDGARLKNAVDTSRKDVAIGTESVERSRQFETNKQQ